jgi:hypothetical protein
MSSLIEVDELPRPDQLESEARAEVAVDDLLEKLADVNVHLSDRPFHLSSKEFYSWLFHTFLAQDVDFPSGGGWHCTFSYAELEPRSPENMCTSFGMFLFSLFRLDGEMDGWTLSSAVYEDHRARPLPQQGRYLQSWRESFRELELIELSPLRGTEEPDDRATFQFDIHYRGVTEDGRTVHHSGRGEALLSFDYPVWSTVATSFPGFHLLAEGDER